MVKWLTTSLTGTSSAMFVATMASFKYPDLCRMLATLIKAVSCNILTKDDVVNHFFLKLHVYCLKFLMLYSDAALFR